jgi:hypothetical protein
LARVGKAIIDLDGLGNEQSCWTGDPNLALAGI